MLQWMAGIAQGHELRMPSSQQSCECTLPTAALLCRAEEQSRNAPQTHISLHARPGPHREAASCCNEQKRLRMVMDRPLHSSNERQIPRRHLLLPQDAMERGDCAWSWIARSTASIIGRSPGGISRCLSSLTLHHSTFCPSLPRTSPFQFVHTAGAILHVMCDGSRADSDVSFI